MRQKLKTLCLVTALGFSPVGTAAQSEGMPPRWDPAGLLDEGRRTHTATLLSSGQVLVVGGKRGDLILPDAELYDPRTGQWTPTGSLGLARSSHTATRLLDGRVLVVGGTAVIGDVEPSLVTARAEAYDPATGKWSETTPLNDKRADHTATLLPSGKVLVAGGVGFSVFHVNSSAEIFDPETETWEFVGEMAEGRWDHSATLLPCGNVLVAGGVNATTGTLKSAEIYHPQTRRWSAAPDMPIVRSEHSAILLPQGQVLVAGGLQTFFSPEETIFFPSEVELYDPETGWSSTGSLRMARTKHSATLLASGKVLLTGGQSGEFPLVESEIYDPETGSWTLDASFKVNRRFHTSTLLPSGQVLVTGGEGLIENGLASTELYTPRVRPWVETEPLPEVRAGHTATLLPSGGVLVAGGGKVNANVGGFEVSIERLFNLVIPGDRATLYRVEAASWSPLPPLEDARTAHTATLLPSGDVLIAGGLGQESVLASVELFRTEEETWSRPFASPMNTRRLRHTATLLPSGRVLVAGGINDEGRVTGKALSSAEVYDPIGGRWTETGSLGTARVGHTATVLPSGKVLVAGGLSENQFIRQCELYDPETGTWSETGRLSSGRLLHTATLLASGEVLVVAGLPATSAELYDPESGTWTNLDELGLSRIFHTATLFPDGRVLVTGGSEMLNDISQQVLSRTEVYDPALRSWLPVPPMTTRRALHAATLLPDGGVLVIGGGQESGGLTSAELYRPNLGDERTRARILEHSPRFRHGETLTLTGTGLRGNTSASQGNTRDSAVDLPLVQLRSLENEQLFWLTPDSDPQRDFSQETATLSLSEFPDALNPGWHLLTVYASGLPSQAEFVEVGCGLTIDEPPRDTTAPIRSTVTFSVKTRGGLSFQWKKDDIAIPGATSPSYTAPPIVAADSGTTYSVEVSNGCTKTESSSARLLVEDDEPPEVRVISPRGGEFWILSTPEQPNAQVVTWEMSDNVRICQVKASLIFSNDGGDRYETAVSVDPSGQEHEIAVTFGPGGACTHPGEFRTSVTYHLPEEPPSGQVGSLYKVRVEVTDHAGLVGEAESGDFFIAQPNNESVKTLILTHKGRLEALDATKMDELDRKLEELADHPRVQGVVVDLDVPDLNELYDLWDEDARSHEPHPTLANLVLFGCHEPLPERCPGELDGVHDAIRDRLRAFPEVENLVLVGDDRIVPFARIEDRTVLLLESNYTSDDPADVAAGVTTRGTTVGQALTADLYLSDDPVAVAHAVRPEELREEDRLLLADLHVGRLVETPADIISAIATFLSQDGVLDLSEPDPEDGHKVLVSGYDFLIDSGRRICERWRNVLGASDVCGDTDLAPVDGELLDRSWGEASVEARRDVFRTHLAGNGEEPYLVLNPNGHATHYELGVPGLDRLDIQGLPAEDFCSLDLAGRVVYGVGCHGGLPVAGDDAGPADHPADLPQKVLAAGVLAYVANTGYGWGLLNGVGLSERLVEIFTGELTASGTVRVGGAVRRAKELYFSESPRFDAYDAKTLMQWTLYGFPMYSIRTGIRPKPEGDAMLSEQRITGGERAKGLPDFSLPRFLTRVEHHFDFRAGGVYAKFDAEGERVSEPGCPSKEGCYYRLNGLATGTSDLPIQPYFFFVSQLSGTRQHGVLWTGATWTEEGDWRPVFAELVSNGGDGSNHGSAPRQILLRPRGPRRRRALEEEANCRARDFESNSVVVTMGEAVKPNEDSPEYSVLRLFRQVNLEVLYFNNTVTGEGNCDNSGPIFGDGPFHEVRGRTVEWTVPVSDAGGVWRVVVVYTDETVGDDSLGRWRPLELAGDGSGRFHGSLRVDGPARLTYYLQAVDRRGNVSWLEYEQEEEAASGVGLGIPRPVDVVVDP